MHRYNLRAGAGFMIKGIVTTIDGDDDDDGNDDDNNDDDDGNKEIKNK